MPKNKKKFIDKKHSVTFHLVHRSQQDPLAADETAPQRVLLAAAPTQNKPKNKDEERKFGIYFDDDYDYLQHLREVGTAVAHWEPTPERPAKEKTIKLPSSVFASELEEDVGLLNKAAPQSGLRLDLDPDIVAAMDEDFDFEDPDNQLDDDFIMKANASGDEEDDDDYEDLSDSADEEGSVSSGAGGGRSEDDVASLEREETKSRFTEFSMSSSVVPRNDQLTLLDDRFEKMFAQYDESEIGALDCDEIEGDIGGVEDIILRLAADQDFNKPFKMPNPEANLPEGYDSDSGSEDERLVPIVEPERWDCESILSTYSNIYNHPKLIEEPRINKIRVNRRTGMPVPDNQLTAKNLAALNGGDDEGRRGPASVISALSTLSIRNKDETPEEKKNRKAALRLYRKERRIEKKANTVAFRDEKKKLERHMINTAVNTVAVHL